MARIKGKWVGQVTVDMEADINTGDTGMVNRRILEQAKEDFSKMVIGMLEAMNVTTGNGIKLSVTVTQLHADLYRDEPSEWTKEEI